MGHRLDHGGDRHAGALIARLDPRLRIVLAALFALLAVSLTDFTALLSAQILAFVALALSGLPAKATLKKMLGMDGFILFMLVLLPFTVPGETLFTLFGFPASREGLAQALRIALRANAAILMLMALVGTIDSARLAHALHALHAPDRLVHLMMFTTRYIDVLRGEYLRLRMAMKCRGFRPRTDLHTYRSFGYLLGMMLVRALERSERILDAMKCRGFDGTLPVIERYSLRRADLVFAVISLGLMATLIGLQATHALA